jgi:hypothetical protein
MRSKKGLHDIGRPPPANAQLMMSLRSRLDRENQCRVNGTLEGGLGSTLARETRQGQGCWPTVLIFPIGMFPSAA